MAAYSSERGAAIAIIIVVTIILYLSFLQRNKLLFPVNLGIYIHIPVYSSIKGLSVKDDRLFKKRGRV